MSKTSPPNRILLWTIVILVALAPVPIGSNRPFFWAANGILVAIITLAYAVGLRLTDTQVRIPLRAVWLPASLFAMAILWMVVQVAPLPEEIAHLIGLDSFLAGSQLLGVDVVHRLSVEPSATLGMIVRYATYGLLFVLVLQTAANPHRARTLTRAVFWIALLHSAAAILMLLKFGDTLLYLPKWAYQGVATGFFVNRNSFATFAAFGIAAGTVLALDGFLPARQGGVARAGARIEVTRNLLVHGVGIAILATAVALSASRMGAVVSALGATTAFVLAFLRPSGRRGGIAIGLLVLLAVAALVIVLWGGRLAERIGSFETNADERLLLYRQVIDMIVARPWTGYGGGTFASAFPLFHHLPLSADVSWNAAHNLYLELFTDLGFVAVAPLLAVLLLVARCARAVVDPRADWIAPAAALSMTVIAAVHSLVDFSLQIEANVLIYVTILGAGTAQAWVAARQRAHAVSRVRSGESGMAPA
jgi:O-antigen ligase